MGVVVVCWYVRMNASVYIITWLMGSDGGDGYSELLSTLCLKLVTVTVASFGGSVYVTVPNF